MSAVVSWSTLDLLVRFAPNGQVACPVACPVRVNGLVRLTNLLVRFAVVTCESLVLRPLPILPKLKASNRRFSRF